MSVPVNEFEVIGSKRGWVRLEHTYGPDARGIISTRPKTMKPAEARELGSKLLAAADEAEGTDQ